MGAIGDRWGLVRFLAADEKAFDDITVAGAEIRLQQVSTSVLKLSFAVVAAALSGMSKFSCGE